MLYIGIIPLQLCGRHSWSEYYTWVLRVSPGLCLMASMQVRKRDLIGVFDHSDLISDLKSGSVFGTFKPEI